MANALVAAGLRATAKLPPHLLAALVPLLVVVLALDVYCLIDVARARSVRNAPKIAWVIVILAISAPVGALLYLFFGKDRGKSAGVPPAASPTQSPADPPAESPAASPAESPADPAADARAEVPVDREPIVTTSGLTRDYGGTGLFDVDLIVPRGSIYGLVGPNGAGKTTLLSIVSGVRRSDSGRVCIDVPRDKIAVCPDVPEFDGWLTAYEVVNLAGALTGRDTSGGAILAALRTAGLGDAVDRRVAGFSRGMVQRLGLACALVTDPELLILDEPTSALDPAGRAEMLSLVAAMRGRKTVIFSSHILADVQRVADQVGIMRDGRLLYQGSASELIEQHLRPSWLVKIAGDTARVTQALRGQPWATRVEPEGGGLIRVDADSIESGERGIPAVIASCDARQVSCEPVAADLESAFLALTSRPLAQAR